MTDTTNVTGFRMYYAQSRDMTDKQIACSTENPLATALSCPNVEITSYPTYFSIAAIIHDGEQSAESESGTAEKTITLASTNELRTESTGKNLNVAPTAVISESATAGTAPFNVSFDGSKSSDPDGTISSYLWDFGDGNTAATVNTSNTFNNAGSFTVTLTVTDDKGESSSSIITIIAAEDTQLSGPIIIGNQSQYAAGRHIMHDTIAAYKLHSTPAYNGTLQTISFTISAKPGKHVKFALYTHDATHDLPHELVPGAYTVEGVATTNDFTLMTLEVANAATPLISAGKQYWLLIQSTDDWVSFGSTWDADSKLVYKNNESYNFSTWGGIATESKTYKIGACYFSYTPH
ncbi:MAG: PKD domain-containing protein [Thermodesulfobacteriota bacterium]